MSTCSKCGSNVIYGAVFCALCGEKVGDASKISDQSESLCSNCGTTNPSGAKFCKGCGGSLEASSSEGHEDSVSSSNHSETSKGLDDRSREGAEEGTVICPVCGAQNLKAAKFCKVDGVRLNGAGSPASVSNAHHQNSKLAVINRPIIKSFGKITKSISRPDFEQYINKKSIISSLVLLSTAVLLILIMRLDIDFNSFSLEENIKQESNDEPPQVQENVQRKVQTNPVESYKPAHSLVNSVEGKLQEIFEQQNITGVTYEVDRDNVVHITGTVSEESEKQQILSLITNINGVQAIVDNVTVSSIDKKSVPKINENIAEKERLVIEERIEKALNSSNLDEVDVSVSNNRTVTIKGVVYSFHDKQRAIQIVRSLYSRGRVVDKLFIVSQ